MKGILMTPSNHLAIREGLKLVTRRPGKPRYKVGEVVYVKEKWCVVKIDCEIIQDFRWLVQYDVESLPSRPGFIMGKWRSPHFMPEWAARDFIKMLSVRQELLQDITEEDAIKEGIIQAGGCFWTTENGIAFNTAREACGELWDTIYPHAKWETNPLVTRYEFSRELQHKQR